MPRGHEDSTTRSTSEPSTASPRTVATEFCKLGEVGEVEVGVVPVVL